MKTLPRHLLLAAVVLTVCCAQRQAVSAVPHLEKTRASLTGERVSQALSFEQLRVRRMARHLQIRPALQSQSRITRHGHFRPTPRAAPPCPVVHSIYPPSRFRLPPPQLLA